MKSRIGLLLALLLLSSWCSGARYALLIASPNPGEQWFTPLKGSQADVASVEALLLTKYQSGDPWQIKKLGMPGSDPSTRGNMLRELDRLVEVARPGDTVVIYYSGHGARIPLKAPSEDPVEQSGYRTALIPSDLGADPSALRVVYSKEIGRRLNALRLSGTHIETNSAGEPVLRGTERAKVVVIIDACHSATGIRGPGIPKGSELKGNAMPLSNEDAKPLPDPATGDNPVLFCAAAQEHEIAYEKIIGGANRGVLTYCLVQSLTEAGPLDNAQTVFERARSRMLILSDQQPVLRPNQTSKTFLGSSAQDSPNYFYPVYNKGGGEFELVGSFTILLAPGTVLKAVGKDIRITIDSDPVFAVRVTGKVTQGDPEEVDRSLFDERNPTSGQPMAFVVDKWVMSPQFTLKVYIPTKLPTLADLKRQAESLVAQSKSTSIPLAEELGKDLAATRIFWKDGQWVAEQFDSAALKVVGPTLGANLKDLSGSGSISVEFPPTAEFAQEMRKALADLNGVEIVSEPDQATYRLSGEFRGGSLQYLWLLPGAGEGAIKNLRGVSKETSRMPVASISVSGERSISSACATLADKLANIAKAYTWLTIESTSSEAFPYELVVRNNKTNALLGAGEPLVQDGNYTILLKRIGNPPLNRKFYTYVFSIDPQGASSVLFGGSNDNNAFPRRADEAEIPIVSGITISPPFGAETLVVFAAEDKLPNPMLLQNDGAGTREAARGSNDPMSRLLNNIGSGTRDSTPVPTRWIVQRIPVQTVPKN